jgi:uncharacterized membrane protein YcjF (UPF0283 family)
MFDDRAELRMNWLKVIAGAACVLVGLVWIGQGTNLIPGSFMTGQMMWAIFGVVLLVLGAWLLGTSRRRGA